MVSQSGQLLFELLDPFEKLFGAWLWGGAVIRGPYTGLAPKPTKKMVKTPIALYARFNFASNRALKNCAIAEPISCGESSWMQCKPLTVTSV